MSVFRNPFRKKPPRDEAALARLRLWAEAALGHPEGLELTISEIECPDPSCPGLETYFLVMRPGEASVAIKIRKPLVEIEASDVTEALRHL